MSSAANRLAWNRGPGHYEVYYLTLTDPASGVGFWLRYTLHAPTEPAAEAPTAALWCLAMDPRPGHPPVFARRETFAIGELGVQEEPFALSIGPGRLTEHGACGRVADAEWDLRFTTSPTRYEHVHPFLRATRVAQTVLTLPQADLTIDGHVRIGTERFELRGARGAQAHLWGSAHARRWGWAHCNDFADADGRPQPGTVLDAVSVIVRRGGREIGPSTPVVGRLEDEDFISTAPLRVLGNASRFALTGWRFEAVAGRRRIVAEVDADRRHLAGVTYRDPDGAPVHCYNSEIASMRVQVLHRARRVGGWSHRSTLLADRRAHFEYAQRAAVPDQALLIR